MDEFENLWNELEEEEPQEDPADPAGDDEIDITQLTFTPEQLNEKTPQYKLDDGIAFIKLVTDMLLVYYHVRHGEPMSDIINENDPDTTTAPEPRLVFHLDPHKKKK